MIYILGIDESIRPFHGAALIFVPLDVAIIVFIHLIDPGKHQVSGGFGKGIQF